MLYKKGVESKSSTPFFVACLSKFEWQEYIVKKATTTVRQAFGVSLLPLCPPLHRFVLHV